MYRLQVYDATLRAWHWHVHKDGSHFFKEYAKAEKRMPVAVAIGADPATIYAATAPMPRGIDELLLAGFFRKKGVPMAKCITVDMEVPADAEFVLEGYVDCDERRLEGRSETTRATTPSPTCIPSSTSRQSPERKSHLLLQRSSARRPWKTATWQKPRNAFSCRC